VDALHRRGCHVDEPDTGLPAVINRSVHNHLLFFTCPSPLRMLSFFYFVVRDEWFAAPVGVIRNELWRETIHLYF